MQDTLIVGGLPAWGVRAVAFAFYGSLFYAAPGLFTWPFHLISFCWDWFVWRPTWYIAVLETAFLWREFLSAASYRCLVTRHILPKI